MAKEIKKKIDKKEEKIKREINLLQNSQEMDKFEFSNLINGAIPLVIIITGFALTSFATKFYSGIYGGIISIILVGVYYRFIKINPIRKRYDKKDKLIISKYKELGVDWEELKKELDKI